MAQSLRVVPTLLVCYAVSMAASQYPGEQVNDISSLPGLVGDLPAKMYSGYTYAGTPPNGQGEMYAHWLMIESENDPSNDPVVVWYQGGPGASSLFGFFVEFGPLLLNEESLQAPAYNQTGVPQLIRNPYSWNKRANVVVIDNPSPVGFSYCTPAGPSGFGTSCGAWNDALTAKAQQVVLTRWVKQMSQFASNPLYITGESYAGVYVPTIVRELLANPGDVNLKGFAVGDGCMGTDVLCGHNGPFWNIEFMHGHGQFSNRLYRQIQEVCTSTELQLGNLSDTCNAKVSLVSKEVGSYYSYNLYDTCYAQNIFEPRTYWSSHPNLGGGENDYPCPGPALNEWLNRTDVRDALHVPKDAYYFSGDNGAGFNYTTSEKNLLPFYQQVIAENKLRVLVYNGDTDPGINSFVTQDKYTEFFDAQGIELTESWRPWTLDGNNNMGGYVFGYASNFHFATVRGSGHMVPEFKPAAASVLINSFLEDEPLPSLKTNRN